MIGKLVNNEFDNAHFLVLLDRLVKVIADDLVPGSDLLYVVEDIVKGCSQEILDEYFGCRYDVYNVVIVNSFTIVFQK